MGNICIHNYIEVQNFENLLSIKGTINTLETRLTLADTIHTASSTHATSGAHLGTDSFTEGNRIRTIEVTSIATDSLLAFGLAHYRLSTNLDVKNSVGTTSRAA